jgi:hypothetical protein
MQVHQGTGAACISCGAAHRRTLDVVESPAPLVAECAPTDPVRRPAGDHGGWGLALVDRPALDWGIARHGRGKVVWCALPATSAELAG